MYLQPLSGYLLTPEGWRYRDRKGPVVKWEGRKINSYHDPYGIFLAWGERIKKGEIRGVSALDLTPTVLADLRIGIPKEMDGRVLEIFRQKEEILTSNANIYREEKEKGSTEGEMEDVKRQLKALGYI